MKNAEKELHDKIRAQEIKIGDNSTHPTEPFTKIELDMQNGEMLELSSENLWKEDQGRKYSLGIKMKTSSII